MNYNSFTFAKTLILQSFSIPIIMNFGDNMMLLRKQKKLSQAALGKLIGTSGDVIGRYERSDIKPSIDVVIKIADTLEVSIDYLIGRSNIELDKEVTERLQRISALTNEDKSFLNNMIDMALRDFKTKKAYSS
jgi:transcriptional regulator with XRE-family HTH domain